LGVKKSSVGVTITEPTYSRLKSPYGPQKSARVCLMRAFLSQISIGVNAQPSWAISY